ncbi:MAG: protein translocase subunit SecF [Myxococcales bacterium]|nr:protein translocase subunit SecF [Myxococcales bacterium]
MFNIISPNTNYDFMKAAPFFGRVSMGLVIAAILVIALKGVNLGLDFSGGHEVLLRVDPSVTTEQVRSRLGDLFPGVDTAVQSFEMPTSAEPAAFYLTRIMRSESVGKVEIETLQNAFQSRYGDLLEQPVAYNPEAGDVVKLDFVETATKTADLSSATLTTIVEGTEHQVRLVRQVGRPDQQRYEIVLKGVDATLVAGLKELDPDATAVRVEFVGPTVGKQLRDDGILAVLYALGFILLYIAFRFDLTYGPGAILCLFHDALITTALLSLLGAQFSLATIAGLLTLVGYSINDTIIVFDRIRETVGKAQGAALDERLNRAINDTLGRTVMTSSTTLIACFGLMGFGRGTVLAEFGLIMAIGIVVGTYSSVYVATPIYRTLRNRFGVTERAPARRNDAQV